MSSSCNTEPVKKCWRCRWGIHRWVTIGRFIYCDRPGCTVVEWFTGDYYWDLDVCNTERRPVFATVQE